MNEEQREQSQSAPGVKEHTESAASRQQEVGQELENIKAQLDQAKKEAAENYDRFVRTLAESDNIKKRFEREKNELLKFGLEGFLKEILPVLDSFDKAMHMEKQVEDDGVLAQSEWTSFVEGMHLVKKQLFEVLERHGLSSVEAVGAKFDPNLHQAIQRLESQEIAEETIKDEFHKGYLLHGRLLRPAIVSVMLPSANRGQES